MFRFVLGSRIFFRIETSPEQPFRDWLRIRRIIFTFLTSLYYRGLFPKRKTYKCDRIQHSSRFSRILISSSREIFQGSRASLVMVMVMVTKQLN